MDFKKNKWTEADYDDFLEYLYSISDNNYRLFQSRIIPNTNIIGINIPTLKKISKDVSKGNYDNFISLNKKTFFEEIMIHGLVIGYVKVPFNEKMRLLDQFIDFIDNWAVCDTICANMKDFKLNLDNGYEFIKKCLSSYDTYRIRVGLVLLLDYYINDIYIKDIFDICNNIKSDEYYVKMANAWLISMCYIKYPKLTLKFYRKNKLDKWTHNKAIQKTIESKRVSEEEKKMLSLLKV